MTNRSSPPRSPSRAAPIPPWPRAHAGVNVPYSAVSAFIMLASSLCDVPGVPELTRFISNEIELGRFPLPFVREGSLLFWWRFKENESREGCRERDLASRFSSADFSCNARCVVFEIHHSVHVGIWRRKFLGSQIERHRWLFWLKKFGEGRTAVVSSARSIHLGVRRVTLAVVWTVTTDRKENTSL